MTGHESQDDLMTLIYVTDKIDLSIVSKSKVQAETKTI